MPHIFPPSPLVNQKKKKMEKTLKLSKRKRRKNPKMENPSSDSPQPQLFNQPSAPVQPPAFVQVPPPQVQSFPSGRLKPLMYKSRLQDFTLKSSIPPAMYQTCNEGLSRSPMFRSSVIVDGTCYVSGELFSDKKAAEQDVARYALECISKKIKDDISKKIKDEGPSLIHEGRSLIREDTVFCKSILNDFACKMNLEMSSYNTIRSEGLVPHSMSSLVFNGVIYSGETGRNKKEAEQLAARAVILSLLDDPRYGVSLSEIIKSKAKLYVALNEVKDSSIFHPGTTAAGVDPLIHNNKEVETAAVTNIVPNSAILQPSSGAECPHHKFEIIKSEQGPECVDLPISFVPPVVAQSLGIGENSLGKRRKKKKKAKLDNDTQ